MTTKSGSGEMNKLDWNKVLKVFIWTLSSAILAGLIAVVESGELPEQVLIYVPIINTFLYGMYRWIQDNK